MLIIDDDIRVRTLDEGGRMGRPILALGVLVALGGCSLFGGGEEAVDVGGSFAGTYGGTNCAGPADEGTFELEIDQSGRDLAGFWSMDGSPGGIVTGQVAGDRIEELTFYSSGNEFRATGAATISEGGGRITGEFLEQDPGPSCTTRISFDVLRPPVVAAAAGTSFLR